MGRFDKGISPAVREVSFSPGLVAILQRSFDEGRTTRKELARIGDFSLTTAYRIGDHGWLDFDQLQTLVDELPEDVAIAIAGELCRRFKVTARATDAAKGMGEALRAAGQSVTLAETIQRADEDQHRTADERAEIQQLINDVRAHLDRLEAANVKPAPRVRAAG